MPAGRPEGPVLVTGARGFIGARLARALSGQGRRLLLLGRSRPTLPPGAAFLRADLGRPETLRRHARALAEVESVFHLGGFVLKGSTLADDDSSRAWRENARGTEELLSLLPRARWIALASTIDVYGPPERLPLSEAHPARPVSAYGMSKLAAEALVRAHARRRRIPAAVLRLAQVYGPGDDSRKAVPAFVKAALAGKPPLLRGGGAARRGYLYVDDAAEAFLKAFERRADGVFNVGGTERATLAETAALAARLAGSRRGPRSAPGEPGASLYLDDRRARRALGFVPRVSLAEGLARAIAWERLGAGRIPIFLDLDGTLLDASRRYDRLRRSLLARGAVGKGYARAWLKGIERPELLDLDRPFPWTRRVLARLSACGPLVIVTLRRRRGLLLRQLSGLGLLSRFAEVLCAPGPRGEGWAVKRDLIRSSRWFGPGGVVAGDTEAEVRAGRALGLATAAVLSGVRGRADLSAERPDHLIRDLRGLPAIARRLGGEAR